jgi:NADH-quinone oxidoreductase subunit N
MLVGLEAAAHGAGEVESGPGVPSVMVYLMAYAVMVIGTFAIVTLVARTGDVATDLDSYRGLGQRRPVLSLALTVLLVAQAGVPFTSGFIAKFGVIQAAVEAHSYILAVAAMVTSVVAAFLYLRIMVSTWIEVLPGDDAREPVRLPFASGLAIAASVGFTLAVGFFPDWLIDASEVTTQFAR